MSANISTTPSPIKEYKKYGQYHFEGPPAPSEMCLFWLYLLEETDWTPPTNLPSLPKESLRVYFGVYDWELYHIIEKTLEEKVGIELRGLHGTPNPLNVDLVPRDKHILVITV